MFPKTVKSVKSAARVAAVTAVLGVAADAVTVYCPQYTYALPA